MEATEPTLPIPAPVSEEAELQKRWNTFLQHCLDAEVTSVNLAESTASFEKFKKETELKIEKFRYAATKAKKLYNQYKDNKGISINHTENVAPEKDVEVSHWKLKTMKA